MLLIEVGEHDIYEGNYWTNRGAKAVDYFLDGKDDYPEAIICANDYMALSICEELKKRGEKNMTHAVLGLTGVFRIWSFYDALVDRKGGVWKNRI